MALDLLGYPEPDGRPDDDGNDLRILPPANPEKGFLHMKLSEELGE